MDGQKEKVTSHIRARRNFLYVSGKIVPALSLKGSSCHCRCLNCPDHLPEPRLGRYRHLLPRRLVLPSDALQEGDQPINLHGRVNGVDVVLDPTHT